MTNGTRPPQAVCLWLAAIVLLMAGTGPASAAGVLAIHGASGYRSPGTNTIVCQFSYPSTNSLWSLLWSPSLPSGWVITGASGDGDPQVSQGEILFIGAFPATNTVSFSYTVTTPSGLTGVQGIDGTAEYLLDGMIAPSQVSAPTLSLPWLGFAPAIDNAAGATRVTSDSALLRGALVSTGGVPTRVTAYWGPTDGTTNAEAWAHAIDLGICPTGPFVAAANGMTPGAIQYYRCQASNTAGTAWAPASSSLMTLAFDPGSYSNLLFWLRADAGLQTNASSAVTGWVDRVSSGNTATQGIVSCQPVCVPAALNDLPVVRFDGTDDYLAFNRVTGIRTLFWVLREDAAATDAYRSILGDSSTYFFQRGLSRFLWDGASPYPNVIRGVTKIDGTVIDGTTLSVPTHFAVVSLTTTNMVQANQLTRDRGYASRVWQGDIAELLMFGGPLTAADEDRVGYYLSAKYGLNTAYTDPSLPLIDNGGGATNVTATLACPSGTLISWGGSPTTVTLYWGTADAGTNAAGWGHTNWLGVCVEGAVAATLTGLADDTTYSYAFCAANSNGTTWAAPAKSFKTLPQAGQWGRRMNVRFAGYTVGSALTNFPTLIVLGPHLPGFRYGDFLSAPRDDLRFLSSDQSAELPYEIESWNPGGLSLVWVRVPSVAGTNDSVWAMWGRSGCVRPAYTTNGAVWADGFAGVWHLNATNGTVVSDSVNRYPGAIPSADAGTWTAGAVGGGLSFDGSNRFVQLPAGFAGFPAGLTLSLWANPSASVAGARLFDFGIAGTNQDRLSLARDGASSDLVLQISSNASPGITIKATNAIQNAQWQHLATTLGANGTVQIYRNGRLIKTGSAALPREILRTDNAIGRSDTAGVFYQGRYDEARAETAVRGSNWVWACYLNQASNNLFLAYDLVQALGPAYPIIVNGAATNVTPNSAWLAASVLSTGTLPTVVGVCWGATDGGTNTGAWSHSVSAGLRSVGPLSTLASGLASNTVHYYRFWASNSVGVAWASDSRSLITGPDTDHDGMDDAWERANFGDLTHDGTADGDADGLTDLEEFQHGTDPANWDTDGDRIPDGWEVRNGLDPVVSDASADPDGDGYSNLAEYWGHSQPTNALSRPAGPLQWVRRPRGTADACARAVTVLADGSSIMTGEFRGTNVFGFGEPCQTQLVSAGGADLFIAKVAPDGTLRWARQAGGPADDVGYGVAAYPDGSFVLVGTFMATATFGGGDPAETQITSPGTTNIVVARYNADGTLAWARRAGGAAGAAAQACATLPDGSLLVAGFFIRRRHVRAGRVQPGGPDVGWRRRCIPGPLYGNGRPGLGAARQWRRRRPVPKCGRARRWFGRGRRHFRRRVDLGPGRSRPDQSGSGRDLGYRACPLFARRGIAVGPSRGRRRRERGAKRGRVAGWFAGCGRSHWRNGRFRFGRS